MALAKDPLSHEQLHIISSSINNIHTNSSFYDTFLGSDLSCHDLIYRFDHDDHPRQSLINFKAIDHGSSSSFLSFDQESYSKSSDHEKEEYTSLWGSSNLHDANYFGSSNGRLLENINCYQTSTDMNEHEADHEIFGLFFNEGNDHTIGGTNTFLHGAQVATSSNKRHADDMYLQGESNQGLKKHCTGAMTKNKPKPKVVISKEPQSIAAKNRRERISERLKVLQELVPNGTKVDLVTMLEKAITYVKFLQVQVKVLATDEFWPVQGGKAPEISEVKEAIDAILSSQRNRK